MDSTITTGNPLEIRRLGGRLAAAHTLAAALAVVDLTTPWLVFPEGSEFGPGTGGVLMLAALGVLTLVGVAAHLRTRHRGWLRVTAALRTVSALTAVPAFVVSGVPAPLVLAAALCVAFTIVDVVLLLAPAKPARER